ncbi:MULTISPECIES: SDR family NAD(P)-dependent oxidoreductase [Pandoraea]|uniref:KR domain-containing protein n=2 Tax=Pandoraea TaxID=93217 RepID=A0AAW7MH83_9BURK|nr:MULTISPECIES: SDR family oxidoreductase [Pandoraea]ALS65169.1 oxidoreductase [Pandoraea apista]MDN4572074.1 KR domain-containing protein [Pandoraea cepalis]MDN4576730.1 KR domain-containing protein [Pandoraea cepalis]QHE91545.1 SDR family oxidoreductase [Pandoraea fibrosis]QHF14897.1 SDR family oxidoreductase [Pandoraea fibrosis]
MQRRFEGKVALVTGAGRGMGRAVSLALASEGASVVVSARTARHGDAVVAEIRALGSQALRVGGDISDREAVQATFDAAAQAHARLDIVVHCAADAAHGRVVGMPDETYDYLIKSNIYAPFWIAKAAAPLLANAPDKGRMIFISSAMANRTFVPGLIPYAASKAYLNAFARGLAVELGGQNILVNVIEPGLIASDRLKQKFNDAQINAMSAGYPVPRAGTPDEIAAAALFLASSDARYITGAALLVDGGVSMVPLTGLPENMSR